MVTTTPTKGAAFPGARWPRRTRTTWATSGGSFASRRWPLGGTRGRTVTTASRRASRYYVVLSLMLLQADAFQIPPEVLRLEGLEPERDLL